MMLKYFFSKLTVTVKSTTIVQGKPVAVFRLYGMCPDSLAFEIEKYLAEQTPVQIFLNWCLVFDNTANE